MQTAINSKPTAEAPKEIDVVLPIYEYLGDDEAPVEMIIVSDFQCPYCIKLNDYIFPDIMTDYVNSGYVKISYLPYPLESKHPLALKAAVAASYADENRLFWAYYHKLFEKSENLTEEMIISEAVTLGMDESVLKERLNSPDEQEKIRTIAASLKRSGISATPSLIINNKLYEGAYPYEKLKSLINETLSRATRQVNPEDVVLMLDGEEEYTILDVRKPEEFAEGHLDEAANINFLERDSFLESIGKLDKSANYIIYCKSGFRSARAYVMMEGMGFTSLYNMAVGYEGWIK